MARETKYSIIRLSLLGILVLALQVHFVPLIEISVWRPDLALLLTLFIGYSYGVNQGTLAGFFLGLFQDALSPTPLGLSAMANSIVGFLSGQARQFKLSYNARILTMIILILIQGSIFFLFYQFKTETTYIYLLGTRVFPNTIYTFLIGLLISVFTRNRLEGMQ